MAYFILPFTRGLGEDTISGFNTLLQEQQAAEGDAVITTALFDARFELLHDRINVKAVAPLTREDYKIGRGTALLDAIGLAMHKIRKAQRHTKEEYRPEKTLFVIITDGEENHSRTYTAKMIRDRIERRRRKYGWDFLFFGANMDAVSVAGKLGIDADHVRTFHTDSQGIQTAYSAMSALSTAFRTSGPEKEEPPRALDNSTIREHWHKAAVFTDSWEGKDGTVVPAEELLPGELSAVLFQVGCYTVRSAQRVYQIYEPGYSPEKETPATPEEVELVWKDMPHNMNRLGMAMYGGFGWSPWQDKLRVTHEISARHQNSPDSPFTVICRATESRDGGRSWSERITAVLTAKKHLAMPDKSASLFVCNVYIGDAFSSDTWYKLDPDGKIKTLSLHPFDSNADKARFH